MKCSDKLLQNLLVESEENSDEAVTRHVDHCPRCQNRLGELAADSDSWHEATSALRDQSPGSSIVIALDEELTEDVPVQADHVSLDFLAAPLHPEMLGRIGDYDVERVIGSGGMGIVFKAFDSELHRPVALKVLAPHLAHSGGARQRFAREAQSAAAVVHENVVPIHNVDTTGKLPFIVMQFVGGHSLQARIDRDGPLAMTEVLRIGVQIAKGLAAAHEQGLVHRDVKPGNILLVEGVDRVLISDFGLARAADDASVTRSGFIAGTPHYMSPEQAHGDSIDCRSDLFGLGSVLYFMCTGRPPFRADGAIAVLKRICHDPHRPVDEVNEQVPAELADLVDELLAKKADGRPNEAVEVVARLNVMLQDSRLGRTPNRSRRSRRKRARRAFFCTFLAIATCAITVTTLYTVAVLAPPDVHHVEALDDDSARAQSDAIEPAPSESNSPSAPTADDAFVSNEDRRVDPPVQVFAEFDSREPQIFPNDAFDERLRSLSSQVQQLESELSQEAEFIFSTQDDWQNALDETIRMVERAELEQ